MLFGRVQRRIHLYLALETGKGICVYGEPSAKFEGEEAMHILSFVNHS